MSTGESKINCHANAVQLFSLTQNLKCENLKTKWKWNVNYLHLGLPIFDANYDACFILLVSGQSYTYPLCKTPAIAFTNPDSPSVADKEDSAGFSVMGSSASNTSQPKTPGGSDVFNGFFPFVWSTSATVLSNCDLLRTQKQQFNA